MIYAITNAKGGVGKTTTTATVGHGLALAGNHVLVIDLDAQGNLAHALGQIPADGLYDVLVYHQPITSRVIAARPNLDLLLSNGSTSEATLILAGRKFRERALTRALEPVRGIYDYILLDCPPGIELMGTNALVAADALIVPAQVDYLATVGLVQLVTSLKELREAGHDCRLALIVPTMYDRVTRESRTVLRQLADHFGSLATAPIPRVTKLREAPAHGKTIFEYAPRSAAALAYAQVTKRVLNDQ